MSRALLSVLLLTAGCPHDWAPTIDPTLPERPESIPEQAPLEVLESGAAALDPALRARALELLISEVGPGWSARALGDPSPWVQRAAVRALIHRDDPESHSQLERFTGQPDRDLIVRSLAAVWMPSPGIARSIAGAWRREPEPWRRVPLALAALVNGEPDARDGLTEALQTGELPLEIELILELGHTGDTALLPSLEIAQGRVEEEIELAIAAARLLLGDAAAEQPFRRAVSGSDVERRLEALDYLVEIERPAATALLRRARSEGPELVSWYVDLALAARSGTDPELFSRAARDPDREVRQLAVRFSRLAAAGGTSNKKVAKAVRRGILEALTDPDTAVRIEAVRAARGLALLEAQPAVAALLADSSQQLRIEAAGTLLSLQ